MQIRAKIAEFTQNPLIERLWKGVRGCRPLRSISVDVTHKCNLRCKGCYFFAEDMDKVGVASAAHFAEFIAREVGRGTNFVTVLGGEPSLVPDRVIELARHFQLVVVTNGLKPLPWNGLEDARIAVSVWGDRETDRELRGYGRFDPVDRSLAHYRDDPRVIWYMTLVPSPSDRTEEMVHACVENGNLVGFNYYGDVSGMGGSYAAPDGFEGARDFVSRMIERYPGRIAFAEYLNRVVTSGELAGEAWGYDVCGSISVDWAGNAARKANGKSYNPHFNAYGPDLLAPRRCCVGEERDCASCRDVWAHTSWVALGLERHLDDAASFYGWVSTVYVFNGICGLIDQAEFRSTLAEINRRDSAISGTILDTFPTHDAIEQVGVSSSAL